MANQRIFTFPSVMPSWHVGHMAKAIRSMRTRMKEIDIVIETRDARLPLTSINPVFEEIFKTSPSDKNNSPSDMPARLIVYNKRDLANHHLEKPLTDAFQELGQTVFFTNSRIDRDVKQVLHISRELAYPRILKRYGKTEPSESSVESLSNGPNQTRTRPSKARKQYSEPAKGVKMMFCGMPNVGKSSLLNALRRVGCHKAKAASEAPMPGHTRSVGGMVKISDGSEHTAGWPIYAFDTPGLMLPYLGHGQEGGERAFKMAIAAIVKESLFDPYDIAAYLFHTLIRFLSPMEASIISRALQLPEHSPFLLKAFDHSQPLPTEELLTAISNRIRAVNVGGIPNLEAAAHWMLTCFRDGKFGRWTLDDLGQAAGTTYDQAPENSITKLIKSRNELDESVKVSMKEAEASEDYDQVKENILKHLASNKSPQKSKTAIKAAAKKAKKEVQRVRQEQKGTRHRKKHSG